MTSVEQKFIKDWSKDLYEKIINAAESHGNGINNREIGNKFKWALLICIGYQCLEKKEYRESHDIKNIDWNEMKKMD